MNPQNHFRLCRLYTFFAFCYTNKAWSLANYRAQFRVLLFMAYGETFEAQIKTAGDNDDTGNTIDFDYRAGVSGKRLSR